MCLAIWHAFCHSTMIARNLTQTTTNEENSDRSVSRRKFLGVGSAAIGATMIAAATAAAQMPQDTEKAELDRSESSPLSPNEAINSKNSDSVIPPPTDHGNVKPFKYPFSFSHKRIPTCESRFRVRIFVREFVQALPSNDMPYRPPTLSQTFSNEKLLLEW